MIRTLNPTVKASRPGGIGLLYGSTMARIQTIRDAVPITCKWLYFIDVNIKDNKYNAFIINYRAPKGIW